MQVKCPTCGEMTTIPPPVGQVVPPPPPPTIEQMEPSLPSPGGQFTSLPPPPLAVGKVVPPPPPPNDQLVSPSVPVGQMAPPPPPPPDLPPPPPRPRGIEDFSIDEFDTLKFNLDTCARRVLVSYPFWGMCLVSATVLVPMLSDSNHVLPVLVMYLLLFALGRWAKKGWEVPEDNTLAYVAMPLLFYYLALMYTADPDRAGILIVGTIIAVCLLVGGIWVHSSWLENSPALGNLVGGFMLLLCMYLVRYRNARGDGSILFMIIVAALCIVAIWILFNLIRLGINLTRWLYHAWMYLQPERRWKKIAPEAAAGLIWVPVLQWFWCFVALCGLAASCRKMVPETALPAQEETASPTSLSITCCLLLASNQLLAILVICLLGWPAHASNLDGVPALLVFALIIWGMTYFLGVGTLGRALAKLHRQMVWLLTN